jgi:hypothetical protein
MQKTDQIRKLAADLIAFADRADRCGATDEDTAVLFVDGDTNETFEIVGGSQDDKNAFFYLDVK